MVRKKSGYVYMLRCADGTIYHGMTGDLRRRLALHRKGRVRYTAPRRPVNLVWLHVTPTAAQARQRELALKSGRTRKKAIEMMIAEFPMEALAPFAGGACQG